jgi:hypothetical protein
VSTLSAVTSKRLASRPEDQPALSRSTASCRLRGKAASADGYRVTRRLAGLVVAISIVGAGAVGCIDDDEATDSTSTTGSPGATKLAPLSGTLGGTADCVWIDADGRRFALLLPKGSTTRATADGLALVDPNGTVVAQSGHDIHVVGGVPSDVATPAGCEGRQINSVFRVGASNPPTKLDP